MLQPTPKPVPVKDGVAGRRLGKIYDDAITIFVHAPVLEQVLDYSEQDLSREIGGWLLGGFHEDQRQFVEVRHFLPAEHARSQSGSLTFTHDTLSARDRQVEREFPGEAVVGWHHTHPGFGIFLSAYDLFLHRNYFNSPWHIALVVDPKRQEFGMFQWRGADVVDCGFVCVDDALL